MRQVFAPAARIGGRKSALFLLLALIAALISPAFEGSTRVLADEAGAAAPAVDAPATPAAGASATPPVSRSFLAYIARAPSAGSGVRRFCCCRSSLWPSL